MDVEVQPFAPEVLPKAITDPAQRGVDKCIFWDGVVGKSAVQFEGGLVVEDIACQPATSSDILSWLILGGLCWGLKGVVGVRACALGYSHLIVSACFSVRRLTTNAARSFSSWCLGQYPLVGLPLDSSLQDAGVVIKL